MILLNVLGTENIGTMQDSLFQLLFLCFCSYKIAAGNSLYHEKQLFFKVSWHCCLYKVAAEQKARTTYDNILRLVKDPEVCEPIRFLREREIVHYQRFGESLRIVQDHLDSKNFYAINPEFDIRSRN